MAQRKPHHPPLAGGFSPPTHETPGYIHGETAIAGFGKRAFFIAQIPRKEAVEIIIKNHYSGRVVQNSYVHLGVFLRGEMVGVLQFGYSMRPSCAGAIVAETGNIQYLELNRMWLSEIGRAHV